MHWALYFVEQIPTGTLDKILKNKLCEMADEHLPVKIEVVRIRLVYLVQEFTIGTLDKLLNPHADHR